MNHLIALNKKDEIGRKRKEERHVVPCKRGFQHRLYTMNHHCQTLHLDSMDGEKKN